ncbi:MAG: adenosylmethionine decarboxylase [Candidatus Pacebacteria bacterium]|nr:adenosylmethionine decarboxylase [Candidatus Paceibacterota bacterium]
MSYKSSQVGNEILCVMHGISDKKLSDTKNLEEKLLKALRTDKFTVLKKVSHTFTPQGHTIAILLAESHVAVHTYPEYNSLYFNLYSCRGEHDGQISFDLFKKYLKPSSIDFSENKIFIGRQ